MKPVPASAAVPCSTLAPFEVTRVEESVENFLRSFPLLDLETGTFKKQPYRQARKERAAYRLDKLAKERAALDIEERILRAELKK